MSKVNWYRLCLSTLVVISIVWLWSSRVDELFYHTLATDELIDIGDAVSFDTKTTEIKPNSYVSVSGILGNKAATLKGLRAGSFKMGKFQVRHLLGSKLYIEYDEETYHKDFSPFKRVSVKGRLVSFGPGSELEKVRKFFREYHNKEIDGNAMLIVVDEVPKSQIRYAILFILSIVIAFLSLFFSIRSFFSKTED